jgi:hypothetical protein
MRVNPVATCAIALSLAGSCLLAQGTTSTLDAVASAMGGKDRVLAVRTLILEGRGENLNFGQNYTPDADTKFEVTSFKRSLDIANWRWLLDQTRVPRFVTANTAPQRQRLGLDGNLGGGAYNVGNDGTMSRAAAQVSADRANDFLYYPITFVAIAYRPTTQVSEEGAGANMRKVNIDAGGKAATRDERARERRRRQHCDDR